MKHNDTNKQNEKREPMRNINNNTTQHNEKQDITKQ